jgi:hypothetical protein
MVMYDQLHKDGLVPGRKVLEVIGEDDPERLIEEARTEQSLVQAQLAVVQGGQGGPPGQDAAQMNMALGAGAMPGGDSLPAGPTGPGAAPPPGPGGPAQPPGGGPSPPQMPGFPPLAGAPGGAPGGPSPVPDIQSEVQRVTSSLHLKGEIIETVGTPRGILVRVTDHRDVGLLKTALKPVAELVGGPGAEVKVEVVNRGRAA